MTIPQYVVWLTGVFAACVQAAAVQVITIEPVDGDATPVLRKVLEQAEQSDVKIVFSKGTYRFRPDYAEGRYCFITNHGNGYKKIAVPLIGRRQIEIEGNGAELIFHGQIIPFLIEDCAQVSIRNLSIDWDIPFLLQATITHVNAPEGWYNAALETNGFSWKLRNNRLLFPDVDGFSFQEPGCSLAFDPEKRQPFYGSSYYDFQSRPSRVEEQADGIVRFYDTLREMPPVGSVIVSKGGREEERYGPAFHVKSSVDTVFENVVVHHALGMGFLAERSENVRLSDCGVWLREETARLVSTAADATHFCNCRGDVMIENCRFENMLDDAANVHGAYVEVDGVVDPQTVRIEIKHFEQSGFEFAGPGDDIWFIHQPLLDRASENRVVRVKRINDRFSELVFSDPLPANLSKGDLLENKTWNPAFTMRGCTVRKNRARNILLKTPKKILIENNEFSSMMASILVRGESAYWYESGAVNDVLIRSNRFVDCVYGGKNQAVLMIGPKLGKNFSETGVYDRNIRFENNTIETFDNHIVVADRVAGLVIAGNQIIQTRTLKPFNPDAHLIELTRCRNAVIEDNRYSGIHSKSISADEETKQSLQIGNNGGF